MNYAFAPHEANFADWRNAGFPGIPDVGGEFLRHLDHAFPTPLWKHQKESIQRCVYAFEVLDWKDVLTNIVTGGGKTTIIGGVVAYMTQVHDIRQHLILVPNTIVRQRILDAFDPTSTDFVYRDFPFFFDQHVDFPKRLGVHVMKVGENPAGIRSANVIVGNIHQLYDGKDNWRVLAENCDRLCIYNDEAHNTRADQYNDLINKLKPKRFFRLDTTATPDRLDGLHPDSEMIYEFGIRQAMSQNIIKRVVTFEPEIEKVTFTYYDWETQQEITADEVPWAEIEAKKIPAVRYTMNPGPMAQQMGIALECLRYQRRAVPNADDGKPLWKPLLFVVALNIEDAKNVAQTLGRQTVNGETVKVLLIHSEAEDEAKDEAMSINKDIRNCKYDAIVSVMMLREGWDVKNISAILLFRKFSYKEIGNQKVSVYGPQVIGRGLRRAGKRKDIREQCHVIDHPIFKHDWLWDMLGADRYSTPLNPGDVIDERKIPKHQLQTELDYEKEQKKKLEEFDWSSLPPVPKPEMLEPISDWRMFLDDFEYDMRGLSIDQTIRQVVSRNLDSGLDTLERDESPQIDPTGLVTHAPTEPLELREKLLKRVRELARTALISYDGQADTRQEIMLRVIHQHMARRFTGGQKLREVGDLRLLTQSWHVFDQVKANFYDPRLIASILANPPGEESNGEQTRHTFEPA